MQRNRNMKKLENAFAEFKAETKLKLKIVLNKISWLPKEEHEEDILLASFSIRDEEDNYIGDISSARIKVKNSTPFFEYDYFPSNFVPSNQLNDLMEKALFKEKKVCDFLAWYFKL